MDEEFDFDLDVLREIEKSMSESLQGVLMPMFVPPRGGTPSDLSDSSQHSPESPFVSSLFKHSLDRGDFYEDDRPAKQLKQPDQFTLDNRDLRTALMTEEERRAFRKEIVNQYMVSCANNDFVLAVKTIKGHFHDHVLYLAPGVNEPVVGKYNMLAMLMLSFEAFPDAVLLVRSIEWEDKERVVCRFTFTGTNVLSHPFGVMFIEIQTQLRKLIAADDSAHLAGSRLITNFARNFKPKTKTSAAPDGPARVSPNIESSTSSDTGDRFYTAVAPEPPVKTASVSVSRVLYFYFDDEDRVIHITAAK